MSYGWVDPDSVRMEEQDVVGDFFKAEDGRRLILKVPAKESGRIDSLLAAQAKHGVVFLDPDSAGLNSVETVRGTVSAETRNGGQAQLQDGRSVNADFPKGTFDEVGYYAFRGTGVILDDNLNVFAADTVPTDDPINALRP